MGRPWARFPGLGGRRRAASMHSLFGRTMGLQRRAWSHPRNEELRSVPKSCCRRRDCRRLIRDHEIPRVIDTRWTPDALLPPQSCLCPPDANSARLSLRLGRRRAAQSRRDRVKSGRCLRQCEGWETWDRFRTLGRAGPSACAEVGSPASTDVGAGGPNAYGKPAQIRTA
jgi:hypothetical protein